MKPLLASLGIATCLLLARPANAATDLTELSIEELMQVQVPTVTSASKFAQKATDAPASITVVTQDEIQRYGYRTLAEVLQSVRGVQITNENRYSYAGIRGFSPPGDFKSGLLLLIDGHPANENIYGSALIGTEGLIDVDLIDHVEVVRGPASALYGAGAFYGVVNVVTRSPDDFRNGEIAISTGSGQSYKTRLTLGHTYGNGFSYLLSGSFFESEGDQNIYFKEFDTPQTNRGVAHNLDFDYGRDALLKLSYADFSVEGAFKWRETGAPDAGYGTVFNDPHSRQYDQLGFLTLRYAHDFAGWKVEAATSVNHYRFHGLYPYNDVVPEDPAQVVVNLDQTTGTWWTAEVQVSHEWQKHHFTLGVDVQDNSQQDQINRDLNPAFTYFDLRQSTLQYGIFLQDEYRLSKTLTLNAAGRYDWYTLSGGDFSSRLGLIYQPTARTSLKLLYGDAFRSPTIYESAFEFPGAPLAPERIHSYEAIWEQAIRSNLRLTANAFFNRIDDLIEQQTDLDGNPSYRNGDSVNTGGAELELEGRWAGGIRTKVSYTYQQSHFVDTGRELFNSPRQLAKLNVIVPLFADKVSLGLELQGASSARTLSGSRSDPYAVGNLTILSRKLFHNFDVSASVYNILDQRYGTPAGPDFIQDVHIQEGRSFRVKLSYTF
jgi:outer membrane receptor for ferrienterochelin and colicins